MVKISKSMDRYIWTFLAQQSETWILSSGSNPVNFIFSNIRDIVSNANKNAEEFRTTMDKALSECKRLDLKCHKMQVPIYIQTRLARAFDRSSEILVLSKIINHRFGKIWWSQIMFLGFYTLGNNKRLSMKNIWLKSFLWSCRQILHCQFIIIPWAKFSFFKLVFVNLYAARFICLQDADRAFLRDLVLKLRPVIFLPGDMICRKV